MTLPDTGFRIAAHQAMAAKAKQALMIADEELRLLLYRQPYQLANDMQRASLLNTLREEFDAEIPLVTLDRKTTGFLVVYDGTPIIVYEADALPFVLGIALATGGIDMARRVSYRVDMLPAPRT